MNSDDVYILRETVSLFCKRTVRASFILKFLFQISRVVVSFKTSASVLACIKLFDGNHTLSNISQEIRIPFEELSLLVQYLVKERFIEKRRERARPDVRYVRQLNFFAAFETPTVERSEYQEKLREAHAVVVGCGGIGSWVVEHLVRCGVGTLTVIDPDIVAFSNLTRQALYFEKDVGKKKVDVLKSRAHMINSSVKVYAVERRIRTTRSLIPLIRGSSIVLQCADQPDIETINDIVSRACFHLSVPHVLCGGYDGHLSYVGQTVIPHKTSCWRCYVEGGVYERGLKGFKHVRVTSVSIQGGTLSPIACITANIHALEAIRVISGFAKPLMFNNKAELDFLSFSFAKTKIPRKKNCSLCG